MPKGTIFISAITGEGVSKLMAETMQVLQSVTVEGGTGKKIPMKVFRPQPKSTGSRVYKEGNTFVGVAPELERIVARTDATSLGVSKALERAGVKPGDRVRCGNLECDW